MTTDNENIKKLILTNEFKELQRIGMDFNDQKNQFDLLSVFDDLIDENAGLYFLHICLTPKKGIVLSKGHFVNGYNLLAIPTNTLNVF